MRVDACRQCGTLLHVKKYCIVCGQPIKYECNKCHKYVDDSIHLECDLIKSKNVVIG